MKCPYCGSLTDSVVDSRLTADGSAIRRRRECLKCKRRFTTYERREKFSLMVVKKDGRREAFAREKVRNGLVRACEKRPVSMGQLEQLADNIESALQKTAKKEVHSKEIGEMVIKLLQKLDDVAYVRFASVYRQFKDAGEFLKLSRKINR